MYNRLCPGKRGHTDEFLNGVKDFVSFAWFIMLLVHSSKCIIVELMKETHPPNNLIPKNYYKEEKIVSKLGLDAK